MQKKILDKTKKAGELLNRGAEVLAASKADEAILIFKQALKLDNKIVAVHFNLGLAYSQKGDTKAALLAFGQAVRYKPSDFEAYNNMGHIYMGQNDIEKAIYCFQKATTINPYLSEGFYNLGVSFMSKGKYDEAIKNYKLSLKIYPNNSIVLNNIGVTLEKLGKTKEAMGYFKKALKINPENAMALANVGSTLISIDPKRAKEFFQAALISDSDAESAAYNLGVCLRLLGDTQGAINSFEKALELNPNFSPTYGQLYHQVREICDWQRADEMEAKIRTFTKQDLAKHQVPAETPFISAVYDQNPKRNFEIAKAWSEYIAKKVEPFKVEYKFEKRKAGAKIRIGYLSCDFHDHATAHLIMGLFRLIDLSKFEIYVYSYGRNDKSSYRAEFEKLTNFKDVINLSYVEIADMIHRDKIDILVDLKGHTANSRMEISALRPAPVVVNYLGFPGTSGADFYDYFITDKIVTPKKQEPYYSEKLVYMPDTYQITDNRQEISKKNITRRELLLPEDTFLFCSFNQPYKIDKEVFDSWMRILKAVPSSALCLMDKNKSEIANLTKEAKSRGIALNRLIFSWPLKKSEHLKRLGLFDLALDTFTCTGMTTTSDALWAGLPVITLEGKHFASRVSSSLLSAVGLGELSVKTKTAYEKLAIDLAKNPSKLNDLRARLSKNRTTMPLFNTEKTVKYIEEAYILIWKRYLSGRRSATVEIKP